ncbi:MAG: hypothetical protein WEB53_14660 [Akkermansiaceae bacterium]
MDKEQARFILRSFRPDGADVNDQDFADALALAMENRELGEWLANERAFDAAFAKALGSVDLPANLREDIIACLAGERGDFPQAEDATDSLLIGAFASIQPPATLRDELITAMERTAQGQRGESPFWRRAAIPLAAAAGIAMAFIFTREGVSTATAPVASGQVRSEVVQASFISTFESPSFDLEVKKEDPEVLSRHLRERKLPCPGCLPPGLEHVKSIGCRELVINGKRGSVMCFNLGEDGIVHLVIFKREDVQGDFPGLENPYLVQNGRWASAQWQNDRKVFILMGPTETETLAKLL